MNSIVTQRFLKCLGKLKEDGRIRSARQFALSLDYLPQSLSQIQKGNRDVTIELIRKAVEAYNFNPVYLFTGDGTMFMNSSENAGFRLLTIVTNGEEEERIVHVPIPAQAGYAGEAFNPDFVRTLPTYTLPDYKYKIGTHRSFDVSGDSMEPTLFEGDKVICSFLEPDLWPTTIKDNYVYVVVTRGDVLVKRVSNQLKENKTLLLLSDNDFYEPYPISIEDVREVWYVRAKISPFLPSPNNIQNIVREEVKELKHTIINQGRLVENLYKTIEKLVQQQ
ncbi:MAG TPA: LexA family transcriptional regulator [Bacteroidetes bacterium]|nr:LexA family transcriptional regulator [Bacteroidota bacterium]